MNAQTKVRAATLASLREPFPANQVSKLPKPTKQQTEIVKNDFRKGVRCQVCGSWHHPDVVHLDYVGHAAATDRLLDTDLEWTWEPLAVGADGLPAFDKNGGLWIKLTVLGVTRLGYGSADGKNGGDAVKEIIGDAIRNAGMRFGMALDLWHKGDLHADEDADADATVSEMPDSEWAALIQLVEATQADIGAMLKHYGVKDLRHLNQEQYGNAIAMLKSKLARLAKDETNAKARKESAPPPAGEFGDLDADFIPY